MSASREKKLRQLQGADRVKKNEPVETKTPVWKKALYWALGVLFVIAFVVVMLFNSSFFQKHSTAATVGEHKISPAMMDIYYTSAYSNFCNQYGDYLSYFLDTSTSLKEQVYDEQTGETWADYFTKSAEDSLVWAYTLCDQAKAEGYKLSDADKANIDAYVDSFKAAATEAGFSSANGYVGAYYGSGVTTKTFREFLEVQYLASNYYNDKIAGYQFSDAEKADFYAKNADVYDTVSLDYCYLKGSADTTVETDEDGNDVTVEPTEEENAAAMEAARASAKEIAEGGEEAMNENDVRSLEDYTAEYLSYVLPAEVSTWAYAADRAEGDIEIFESGAAVYVVRFLSRNDHNYNTKDIRLIQIVPETVPDVTTADGEKDTEATAELQTKADEAAKKEARKAFEAWQDGEMTEESFQALVSTYSDDEASKVEAGLVKNVSDSQYTAEVNEWLYAAGRQAGDCELFTEDSTTSYIVYFVGDGDNYQRVLVSDAIVTDAYNTWYENASAPYSVVEKSGMRYVETR